MNDFVSYYRRFNGINGKQSFSLLYTSVNVLAGHYTSYGVKFPVPEKRKKRLLQVCRTVQYTLYMYSANANCPPCRSTTTSRKTSARSVRRTSFLCQCSSDWSADTVDSSLKLVSVFLLTEFRLMLLVCITMLVCSVRVLCFSLRRHEAMRMILNTRVATYPKTK